MNKEVGEAQKKDNVTELEDEYFNNLRQLIGYDLWNIDRQQQAIKASIKRISERQQTIDYHYKNLLEHLQPFLKNKP